MGQVRFHKVVSALPSPLEKDGLYLVRTGEGFDLYASDSTGAIAHKVNTGAAAQDTGWRNFAGVMVGFPVIHGSYGSIQAPELKLNPSKDQVLFRRIGDRAFVWLDFKTPLTNRYSEQFMSGRIPEGFRPARTIYYPLVSGGNLWAHGLEIYADGRIKQKGSPQITNAAYSFVFEYIPVGQLPAPLPGEPWTPT